MGIWRFKFLYMKGSRQMWVIQGTCIFTCTSSSHLMEVHLPESWNANKTYDPGLISSTWFKGQMTSPSSCTKSLPTVWLVQVFVTDTSATLNGALGEQSSNSAWMDSWLTGPLVTWTSGGRSTWYWFHPFALRKGSQLDVKLLSAITMSLTGTVSSWALAASSLAKTSLKPPRNSSLSSFVGVEGGVGLKNNWSRAHVHFLFSGRQFVRMYSLM